MTLSATGWVITGGSFVITVGFVAVIFKVSTKHPRSGTSTEDDGLRRSERPLLLEDLPSATDWLHAPPSRPFPPDEAQRVMQDHRHCDPAECPRKLAAIDTLIRSGRMKPPAAQRVGRATTIREFRRPRTPLDNAYDTEQLQPWA